MIKLVDVRKTHINNRKSRVEALKGVSLELPNKGLIVLAGGNGSGKTTLLNILGGLDTITSGQLIIADKDFSKAKQSQLDDWRGRDVSFVFQSYNLLSDYTVLENIRLGKSLSGEFISDERISEILKVVKLEGFEDRHPKDLSGGEKQKVAIARALIKNPQVIFVDEPTAQLDPDSTETVFDILRAVSKNLLVVCVSHKVAILNKYADKIIELEDGLVKSKEIVTPLSADTVQPVKRTKSIIKPKYALSMGVKNLLKNPVKAAAAILITAFSLLLFMSTAMLYGFDRHQMLANDSFGKNDYYIFAKNNIPSSDVTSARQKLNDTVLHRYIGEFDGIPVLEGVSTNTPNAIIITNHIMTQILSGVVEVYDVNAVAVSVAEPIDVVGKTYLKVFDANYLIVSHYNNNIPAIYVEPGFVTLQPASILRNINIDVAGTNLVVDLGGIALKPGAQNVLSLNNSAVSLTLAEDEIFVSNGLLLEMGVTEELNQAIDTQNIKKVLTIAGVTKEYKIVGRVDISSKVVYFNNKVFAENNNSIFQDVKFPTTALFVEPADILNADLARIIRVLDKDFGIELTENNAAVIINYAERIDILKPVFMMLSICLLAITVFLIYYFIANIINDRRIDIGILRSLGARASAVLLIFISTVSIMLVLAFTIAFGLSFAVCSAMNSIATTSLGFDAVIATVDILNMLLVFVGCALITFIATFMPIYKYSNQAPFKQFKK